MPTAINRLRNLARALERGELPAADDAAWFAEGARAYERGAADGLRLGSVLGLEQAGHAAWWRVEAKAQRDATVREIAGTYFPDLSSGDQAREIAKAAARLPRNVTPIGGPLKTKLAALIAATDDRLPGVRQLETILAAHDGSPRNLEAVEISERRTDL